MVIRAKLVTSGHTWSQVVTFVIVEVKELNNDGVNGYNCSEKSGHTWSQDGNRWSHWSLSRSMTSAMTTLMVIMSLWPLIRNLSRRARARVRARNASLIDLLASPQVKNTLIIII